MVALDRDKFAVKRQHSAEWTSLTRDGVSAGKIAFNGTVSYLIKGLTRIVEPLPVGNFLH
jgi:hypothetical protein